MKTVLLFALVSSTAFLNHVTCKAELRVDISEQSEMYLFVNSGNANVASEYVDGLNNSPGVTRSAERYPLELTGRFDKKTSSFSTTYQMKALSPINHSDPIYYMEGNTTVVFDLPQPAKYEIAGSTQGILGADTTDVIFNVLLRDGDNRNTLFSESTRFGDEPGVTELVGDEGVLARGRYRLSTSIQGEFGKEDVSFASAAMRFTPTALGALPEANSFAIWAIIIACLLPLKRRVVGNLHASN